MKNIILVIALIVIGINFNACSGGGGGDASFSSGQQIIQIDVNCTTVADIATYISLQSNDAIVKNDNNTSVSIYHDLNGTKKICLVSGSAHILR